MSNPVPRVRAPNKARVGEVIEIRSLISHAMESGQRRDPAGKVVPRKIINKFTASFNGKTFFEADWHPAVSANPYQAFFFRATESGEFKFAWTDDDGTEYSSTSRLAVG
jgi:sulfur-oxidizing protein SoxZ